MSVNRRRFIAASAAGLMISSGGVEAADAEPKRIRIGQIGVGHAHASKLAVYRDSPDYEVVGIVEPDDALWQRAKSQPAYRGLPRMTRQQLLDTAGVQAVLVETRVRDLLDNAEACIAAGKHIHLDKPAGESLPQFERILAAAERQGLLVQLGYMYRYNPAILLLHDFLQRGWLGEVFEIHTVMSKVIPAASRRSLAEYRGGTMFELGCHILDLVVGVLGEPANVTPFIQHASSEHDDSLKDNMLAVLQYPQALATVKSSAQEVAGFGRRHFVVCGSEGTFHIQPLDNPSARVALSKPRGPYKAGYQDVTFPKFTRYVADAADMAQIIRGEKASDFSYAHDLAVQRTLLKASGLPLGE
ncbi:Gfo/Idh/MocA family protein [Roseimaritima sediminicola]|uniref:Gfo/Idh/MocA family protein n=1 Tax=Roseimaritima sediminicola TaxID=2662066 RepID=UPI00129824CF|nr:Gfo/Idh/MocA family oxidoreductase [Roseimaritima sediminicola]